MSEYKCKACGFERNLLIHKECPQCVSKSSLAAPDGSPAAWSVKPIFAWYDMWVGIFWDSRKRKLYILPIPCVGLVFEFPMPGNS